MLITNAWHSSDKLFDFPDLRKAAAIRNTRPPGELRRSHNGGLGFWVSLVDESANHRGYGTHLYSMQLHLRSYVTMGPGELAKYRDPGAIQDLRARLRMAEIDAILIREQDGQTKQAIILNTSRIRSFRLVSSKV